jgi:hypothetical protein
VQHHGRFGSIGAVALSDGTLLKADEIIVATEEPAANRLLGLPAPNNFSARSTCCLYFAVQNPPIREATLVLNGDGTGPINNLSFVSFAQPTYAPSGKTLLSVSTVGMVNESSEELLPKVMGSSEIGSVTVCRVGNICGHTESLMHCRINPQRLWLVFRQRELPKV